MHASVESAAAAAEGGPSQKFTFAKTKKRNYHAHVYSLCREGFHLSSAKRKREKKRRTEKGPKEIRKVG